MARPAKTGLQSGSAVPMAEQQRIIAAETAAFIAGGGQIQQIPKGVSGYAKLGGPQAPAAGPGRPARTG